MIIPPDQNTMKDEGVSSLEVHQLVASGFEYSYKRTEKNYFSKRNVKIKAVLYVYFPEVSFATTKFHFSLFASWTSLQQNTFRFPCI